MSAPTDETAPQHEVSKTELLSLAAGAHTYESFGRAVVQALIRASAEGESISAGIQVTGSVTPLVAPRPSTTFDEDSTAATDAAGSGAASQRPCFQIALDLGGWPTTIKVCP